MGAMAEVPYMERTRAWYEAQGYERAYRWAHFEDVPFTRLPKPLSKATLGVVITAMPLGEDERPVLPKRAYALPADPPPEHFYTDDLAWDRQATHLDDRESLADYAHLVGVRGVAHTDLRPGGKAEVDHQLLDVIVESEPIDRGTPIVVVEAHGGRVVVRSA